MSDLKDLASLRLDRRARTSRSPARVWVAVLVLALIAAASGGWWWTTRTEAATVQTVSVLARNEGGAEGQTVLNASGYVTARRRATVSSKITGKVIEVHVEEGMRVRAGQVLARLDDSMTQANLSLVEAQLAGARTDLEETHVRLAEARLKLDRQKRLAADGITPQSDLDTAQAEVDALRARIAATEQSIVVADRQVNVRRTELADTVIRAPFDGVAISKDAQPGEMISPVSAGGGFTRTGICTLVDMSSLEIEVDVNEAYIQRVVPKQRVTAILDAYPEWQIPAHVITTVPSADRQKATVLVRIDFDELDARILPDMGVKVSFLREPTADDKTAREAARPRMLVPKRAVRSADGASFVFVVRDGRAERRAIGVGPADGDQIEVVSGLNAGERVIVEGPADLTDGARVEEASRS